jgi:hypothetical protein
MVVLEQGKQLGAGVIRANVDRFVLIVVQLAASLTIASFPGDAKEKESG